MPISPRGSAVLLNTQVPAFGDGNYPLISRQSHTCGSGLQTATVGLGSPFSAKCVIIL